MNTCHHPEVWTFQTMERCDDNPGKSLPCDAFTDLHGLVEDAAANLNHLQVLLLIVSCTLYVRHPAPLVLLARIDEIPDSPVLVEHLRERKGTFISFTVQMCRYSDINLVYLLKKQAQ